MKNIGIAAILSLAMFSCSREIKEQEQSVQQSLQPNVVKLTSAQKKNAEITVGKPVIKEMNSTIRVTGVIDVPPSNRVYISNPFGGFVKEMNLVPGTRVRKGEILAVMEDPQYIQLQQDYLMAKNRLEFLEIDFTRQQDLNSDKSISDKAFQQVSSEYSGQKILVRSLYEKLKLININPDQLTGNRISRSVNLYSPIQGYLSAVNVSIGKYVNPTDVLFEVVDERNLHVSLTVFEKDLPSISPGQTLRVESSSGRGKEYLATVHTINKTLGEDRSSEIHCDLIRNYPDLYPGMFVTAVLSINNADVLTVPEESVVTWENENFIFTETSNEEYVMTPVELGMSSGGFVEIKTDLQSRNLVTRNAYSLLMKLKSNEEE